MLWIHALLTAADNGGVAAYWRDKNPHGKKVSVEENLHKKVLEVAPPAPGEDVPSGRSLLQRVEIAALTWRAGEARKSAMNDSQWQAALKQQREDPPLRKGVSGYKEWLEVREYLKLLGWVDAELEDTDPRCPSEADEQMVAEYKEVLADLDDALAQSQGAKSNKKEGRSKAARAEATRDRHGLAAERLLLDFLPSFSLQRLTYSYPHSSPHRLALAVGSRHENLDSMRSLAEGTDPNRLGNNGSLADSDSDMEDGWIPPELGSTLELGEDEQHLLNLCLSWEAFREVPVVDLEATELPPRGMSWTVGCFRRMRRRCATGTCPSYKPTPCCKKVLTRKDC